jgi:hypothetical protein
MNRTLENRFRKWRSGGFTPEQAAGHWSEMHALASPILFSRSALREDHRLRAVAAAHHHLATLLLDIDTQDEWLRYCQHHPLVLGHLTSHLQSRWEGCGDVLKDYWPLLAMDEGSTEYSRRIMLGNQLPSEREMPSWEELEQFISHRHAMHDLVEQAQTDTPPRRGSWQATMKLVGLRSLRWSIGGDPCTSEQQALLMETLRSAQERLRRVIGWPGPLLGLAGSTSLALTDNGNSHGVVQPDPGGPGQTMTLRHWSVLAHEWLHSLDIRLARHFGFSKPWATQVMLGWNEDALPPVPMMAWGLQVSLIMGVPRPELFLNQIQSELLGWDQRVLSSMGNALPIQEEVRRQKRKIATGTWALDDASRGWRQVFSGSDTHSKVSRTASLLAHDTGFSLAAASGKVAGTWSEYIDRLRVADRVSQTPGLHNLLQPVEVVARSFEVAMASTNHRPGGLVWLPSEARPNAGLLWPLPSEAAFHARGWENTLRALRPLWKQWRQ